MGETNVSISTQNGIEYSRVTASGSSIFSFGRNIKITDIIPGLYLHAKIKMLWRSSSRMSEGFQLVNSVSKVGWVLLERVQWPDRYNEL